MNTAEMVLLADKNGKTYYVNKMLYNKKLGFHNMYNEQWPAHSYNGKKDENGRCELNAFIHQDKWKEYFPEYTHEDLIKLIGHDFFYVIEESDSYI